MLRHRNEAIQKLSFGGARPGSCAGVDLARDGAAPTPPETPAQAAPGGRSGGVEAPASLPLGITGGRPGGL
jgi:hypothetical protein